MTLARSRNRGMTLVELLVALAIMATSLLGIAALQIMSANMNQMSQRMANATALATDLIENCELWPYNDPRLATTESISATTAPLVAQRSILVSGTSLSGSAQPTFAEGNGTPSALNNNALYNVSLPYNGYTQTSVSGGVPFQRYWSVFKLISPTDGQENGKLVVVTVLWNEPATQGYREITASTFIANPAAMAAGVLSGGS